MKFLKVVAAVVLSLSTLVAVIFAADNLVPSQVQSVLPASATDIQEYHDFSGFQGDGVRYLIAKMPESEMPAFAARLGLPERYVSSMSKSIPLLFGYDENVPWWNPPSTLDGAYFHYEHGKDRSEAALYHNGYVYYRLFLW